MELHIRNYFTSVIKGMGSVFDISGSYYNSRLSSRPSWMKDNLTPQEKDELAIKGDWENVGNDLKTAMGYLKKPLSTKRDLSRKL